MDIIKIDNLYFRYTKEWVLENINLSVNDKDFLGIVGPNGGGKTTLLKLIAGLLKPTKGKVTVKGKVSYVPQHMNLDRYFPISVLDVVKMGLLRSNKNHYTNQDIESSYKALEAINAKNILSKRFGEISGGERQKTLLARALVSSPDILILDEPTANIDNKTQELINEVLKELNKEITIILVSHQYNIITSNVKNIICVNKVLKHHDSYNLGDKTIIDHTRTKNE